MPEVEVPEHRLSNPHDDRVLAYQAVSRLAVAGLIFGIAAAVAFIHPLLWTVPAAGILVAGLALWRIARDAPALIGRKAAVAGLMLSIFCGAAAASGWSAYRGMIRGEARRFTEAWFQFLRDNEPHKAHQLTLHPRYRLPLNDSLWGSYEEGSDPRSELENYVSRPEIRALLALGPKAQVRYYDTEGQTSSEGRESVYQVYAVTYDEAGKKKTFFIGVALDRFLLEGTGRAAWRILHTDGGIRPAALGGTKEETPLAVP